MSSILEKIKNDDQQYLFQNYGTKYPVSFIKGEKSFLYDQDGNEYIDFLAGIAVSSLGYSCSEYKEKLHDQIDKILHSSNHFYNQDQIESAKLISRLSFSGKTLFVNSGTEANEAAIKLARKYGQSIDKNNYKIISFKQSFHGRTFASMTATGQDKVYKGFGPVVEGFVHLPYNDINTFKETVKNDNNFCAVLLEIIQGEGGIIVADKKFITEIADICKSNKILLIIDEIQTGIGRTGKSFGYQHYNINPDIITLAKGLAGGIPIGAIHAKENIAKYFTQGTHGTTFGGNHLACAASTIVLKQLLNKDLIQNINEVSEFIFKKLNELKNKVNFIKDVRGMGLHIGIELTIPGKIFVDKALQNYLVINVTSENVIRIMPPLNIKKETIKRGLEILEKIFTGENVK